MSDPNSSPTAGFDFNHPTIIAILYLASFVVGITGIVGVILAYVWRGEAGAGWEASHYTFHIRTFWIALVGSIISVPLIILLGLGLLLMFAIAVWVIVRSVLALLAAQKQQPIANPETFIW